MRRCTDGSRAPGPARSPRRPAPPRSVLRRAAGFPGRTGDRPSPSAPDGGVANASGGTGRLTFLVSSSQGGNGRQRPRGLEDLPLVQRDPRRRGVEAVGQLDGLRYRVHVGAGRRDGGRAAGLRSSSATGPPSRHAPCWRRRARPGRRPGRSPRSRALSNRSAGRWAVAFRTRAATLAGSDGLDRSGSQQRADVTPRMTSLSDPSNGRLAHQTFVEDHAGGVDVAAAVFAATRMRSGAA